MKINLLHKANGDHVTNTSHRFVYLLNNEKKAVNLLYLLLLMNENEKKNVT